jgi:hypothetical protein
MRNKMFGCVALLLLCSLVGCGGQKADPNSLPAPSVLVTVDGEPLKNLFLQIVAADGTPVASGSTDKDGKAPIRMGDGQPVAPGVYKVVVVDSGEDDGAPKTGNRPKLPAAYGKANSTKAALTIEAGKMDYTMDIKTK